MYNTAAVMRFAAIEKRVTAAVTRFPAIEKCGTAAVTPSGYRKARQGRRGTLSGGRDALSC